MLDAIPFIYQEQRRLAGRTGFANILSAVVANKGLASEVGVGSTDGSTVAAGIYFGSAHDTNLYRNSAGSLKTDGQLSVLGNINALGSSIYFGVALDTNLYRSAANTLKTDGSINAVNDVVARLGAAGQVYVGNAGPTGQAGISLGSVGDTTLYRATGGQLRTGSYFSIVDGMFLLSDAATAASGIRFGSAQDANLYRSNAGELSLAAAGTRDGSLILGYLSSLRGIDVHSAGGSSQSTFMSYLNATDSVPTFLIRGGGKHEWGPGGAAAMDAYIERMAVAQLKFTGNVQATDGFATKTKAGTPSDADFTTAPPTGTIVVDTTANKIWVRTGAATWKGVVVA